MLSINSSLPCYLVPSSSLTRSLEVETIRLESGYFRLHSTATTTYVCDTANCVGGYVGNGTSICREGSGGVLCAVCEAGFHLTTARYESFL